MNDAKKMAAIAYDALDEKKGLNISIIDISDVSPIADYFIIATGSSNSQVSALVDNVEEKMHTAGYELKQREGGNNCPWVLLDYTDVIVHVFDKENRSFYNLEHIWHDGKEVSREEI
ncbi:MAG: ribosome silencing factor [Eubacteriales bacterium]|nr:ribosome silencing factor [Eubacteriales bacterium]